ncbi:Uncharacterised protein [Vibrio cholerae]|nr:Uncharacterised protein [Vibrio cholerae]
MDGIAQRLHHHQHAGTATVGFIIDSATFVMSEITRIPRFN